MFGEIRNQVGERLDYSFVSGAEGSKDLVVIGHGVTANKDREWAITLARVLQAAGYASMRFSFSGNGDSEGDFRDSCPSKEALDLSAVLDAVDDASTDVEVIYVGHSMGGAVGVLVASEDPRIQRLVSLAGMVDTADFAQRKFGDLVAGSDLMWDKPECPLSQVFLDDMERISTVQGLAQEVQLPWLLIHGTSDTVVPIEESRSLAALVGEDSTLVEMDGVDHVFSGDAAEEMAHHVVQWLGSS
ncbi:MAG: alpha/beta hydrolase [Planctomycetota bacterium]|jgi:pimeloyl-ACP methyl ester carboxylesterase